jgi:hypothetical protein
MIQYSAVVELPADNSEEVLQDRLSPIEGEILCKAKMADIPRASATPDDDPSEPLSSKPKNRQARQLAPKL